MQLGHRFAWRMAFGVPAPDMKLVFLCISHMPSSSFAHSLIHFSIPFIQLFIFLFIHLSCLFAYRRGGGNVRAELELNTTPPLSVSPKVMTESGRHSTGQRWESRQLMLSTSPSLVAPIPLAFPRSYILPCIISYIRYTIMPTVTYVLM